jgi:7,8-dihydropterin-6-yl-methyl-4-(beta-D-ribofuranosyl)aminobenzene 5'-phosphate synthase
MSDLEPVDGVEIQVLVDNLTDSLSTVPDFVTSEWKVLQENGLRVIEGNSLCCANHGLSLVIATQKRTGIETVLFDAGPVDYAVERNGVRLGIDFGEVGAVVLSHGHWDHAGGIPTALSFIGQGNGGTGVPLYLHPEMFHQRGTRRRLGPVLPMQRVLGPAEWALLGANPIVTDQAQVCLSNSFFVSGEIPRITSYERGFPGHVRMSALGFWEPDELLQDERFLAVHVRDKGLVVFSACSHAGIVNVLHEARAAFPKVPLYAVMGGFHLAGDSESIIPETVKDMEQFDLDYIIPAHCTGWRAVNALTQMF